MSISAGIIRTASRSTHVLLLAATLLCLPLRSVAQAPEPPIPSPTQSSDSKSASGKPGNLSPFDPAPAPARPFSRPRIGLALGGGGALALSEVGVLEWFEEHHIPVDVMAGTSMGCMVSALYSTGRTPEELKTVMNDRVFTSVFSISNSFTSRSFRRREDSRAVPNGLNIGLRHGVSFRNAVLADQGLNAFLDRQFLRYDDRTDFNALPIPLRCVSTDLTDAQPVVFARGSIPDAIRASVSLPAFFQPFERNGHEYVDGGVLENLPTPALKDMQPDVVLAVSLPISKINEGELSSILGVLQRSFSVAIEGAERSQRKLADVVLVPDLQGFTASDYLKTIDLAKRGYAVAEANRDALLKYAVSDADWSAYLDERAKRTRGPAGPVLRVRVAAPNESATRAVERLFAPLVNQPVDTRKIEALLDQVRSDGRFEADYTVGYETPQQFAAQAAGRTPIAPDAVAVKPETHLPVSSPAEPQTVTEPKVEGAPNAKPGTAPTSNQPGVASLADHPGAPGTAATLPVSNQSLANIAARPVILVTVSDKKTSPPSLLLGANLQTQTTAFTRATVDAILLDQDFGGYGAELRTTVRVGYLTQLSSEYFRPLNAATGHTFFLAPRGGLLREPFPIYSGQTRVAVRQLQTFSTGADVGLTNQRTQELRAGLDFTHLSWNETIGTDNAPSYTGTSQRARLRYAYDSQDRALVPTFGLNLVSEASYLYDAVGSRNTPQFYGLATYAHRFSIRKPAEQIDPNAPPQNGKEILVLGAEGGTMFGHNVAQPFRYTLGGPFRLSASAIDQYRGTEYFLVEPAILHRIAKLPPPLGQSFYVGATYEFGQVRAPDAATLTRQDVFFGIVAETPLGVITFGPAIGSNDERKFIFTLGKLF